jgi:transposase
LAPPPDDDHPCAWREYAATLLDKLEQQRSEMEARHRELEAKLSVLAKALEKKSEKRARKVPPPPAPPKDPVQTAELRLERARTRAAQMETKHETVPVPDELKRCGQCGDTAFRKVGDGKTCEIYSFVRAHFRRTVITRETVACRCGSAVVTAPAPARWSENVRYDSSFVAHVAVSKCLTVTPHYRLEKAFERAGVPISRSTLNDLFRRAGQKLRRLHAPLFAAIARDLVVHVDETSFKMTKRDKRSYVWAFVGDKLTGYWFAPTRGGDVPVEALGSSPGTIVCDDYSGYSPLAKRGGRRRAGCHAHARRKFFEAGECPESEEALALFAGLYHVENEAKRRQIVGTPEHLALRRSYARPLFVRLLLLARDLRRTHGPKTLLGRAARYTWSNQRELRCFLRDPNVRLDNNPAENALRIVALGRKNFLFVHSDDAGRELAILYSLVTSSARLGLNPEVYLAGVLDRIDKTNDDELDELLPDRWKPPPEPSPAERADTSSS